MKYVDNGNFDIYSILAEGCVEDGCRWEQATCVWNLTLSKWETLMILTQKRPGLHLWGYCTCSRFCLYLITLAHIGILDSHTCYAYHFRYLRLRMEYLGSISHHLKVIQIITLDIVVMLNIYHIKINLIYVYIHI